MSKVSPFLIAVEGTDGVGKTTLATQLSLALQPILDRFYAASGLTGSECQYVGAWSGTEASMKLREVMVNTSDKNTQLAIALAGRNELIRNVLHPRIKSGHFSILDRYMASTVAYQSESLEDMSRVMAASSFTIGPYGGQGLNPIPIPLVTLFLEAPESVCLKRIMDARGKLDTIEATQEFQKRSDVFHAFFHWQSQYIPEAPVYALDATRPTEEVLAEALRIVTLHLEGLFFTDPSPDTYEQAVKARYEKLRPMTFTYKYGRAASNE